MAKIARLPGEKIISGFKGTLDYYLYMGLAVVRKWPSSPGHKRTPAVEAWWMPFGYASQEWKRLSPDIRRAFGIMAGDSGLSDKDMFQRAYLKGLYRNPLEEKV